mmetsp:Transcript_32173/g.63398  ORF Transcript_32173/g.63398 Transcript_32173/m.63398 type:complete len:758 (+) Transcript_32173:48-2321(+)
MYGQPVKRARLDPLFAPPASPPPPAVPTASAGDALSVVVALLAAAQGNSSQLEAIPGLSQVLSLLGAATGGTLPTTGQGAQLGVGGVGDEDAVQIPNSCVGWLKGRQGGMIRDIEMRSGAQVEIDQTTKDLGFSTAKIRGTGDQRKVARGLVIAEVAKVMDQSGTPLDSTFPGNKEEFRIDSQYVGWLKGPKGKVIQDLQMKSGTRIEVDQTQAQLGYATVKIFGTPEGTAQARALVAHELSKIGPDAAAQIAITAAGDATGSSSHASLDPGGTVPDLSLEDAVCIPNAYVGWLKGRQGGMVRDIEQRSGAQIDIDQSMKELGYSVARLHGSTEQKATARGLVIGEIAKVMDQSGEVLDASFPGTKEEFQVDSQYVGWLKGPKGKVIQELQVRSATRIEVDQTNPQLGYATVKIFGTLDGIQQAKTLIAAELSKVSPEAAAQISPGALPSVPVEQPPQAKPLPPLIDTQDSNALALRAALSALVGGASNLQTQGLADLASLLGGAAAASTAPPPVAAAAAPQFVQPPRQPVQMLDPSEVESVRIPNSCVGWLKGRAGAMIREIESRSGAQIDIDQSTKELGYGYSLAHVRGGVAQRRTACGLVIAEIAKVMDQSGEQMDDSFGACKVEIQIDSQYVGWLKGPRGKVVQDLQVKSGTRIDVDQSNPHLGTATVKVFGDLRGTQEARALIAQELSKVNPEVAAQISGDSFGGYQSFQASIPTVIPSPQPVAALPPLANPQSIMQDDSRARRLPFHLVVP